MGSAGSLSQVSEFLMMKDGQGPLGIREIEKGWVVRILVLPVGPHSHSDWSDGSIPALLIAAQKRKAGCGWFRSGGKRWDWKWQLHVCTQLTDKKKSHGSTHSQTRSPGSVNFTATTAESWNNLLSCFDASHIWRCETWGLKSLNNLTKKCSACRWWWSSSSRLSVCSNQAFFFPIDLFERQSESEKGEREIFHPLLSGLNSQGCARSEPGAGSSILISHISGSGLSTWLSFVVFPDTLSGSLIRRGTAGAQSWPSRVRCQHGRRPLYLLNCSSGPRTQAFNC